jgi:hypothetical protein
VIKAALANTAALIRHALPRRVADLNGDKQVTIPMLPSSILGFNIYEPQLRLTKSESNLKSRVISTSSSSSGRLGRISGLFKKRGGGETGNETIEEEEEEPTLHERTPVETPTISSSLPQFVVDPPTPPSPGREIRDRDLRNARRSSGTGSLRIFTGLKK